MSVNYNPRIITDGLAFCYDFANREKAFNTTNLIPNAGLGIYNNVPAHVTASLTQTSETYRGSPVWELTLTPTTATGVSYLTAGNNPGIGVYTGGGGGTGGVYTGHSIFYKPTVPMHSSPIYTNYSNIGGWQSSTNYDDMGDGWYRAHVVWYNATTLSDAKYWAINPASATLNVPITFYWAAPFKEAQNYTNFVSPYTLSTRGSGSGIANLANQAFSGGEFVNGPLYNSDNGGYVSFDGTDDYIQVSNPEILQNQNFTLSVWVNPGTQTNTIVSMIDFDHGASQGWTLQSEDATTNRYYYLAWYDGTTFQPSTGIGAGKGIQVTNSVWQNIVYSKSGITLTGYLNGVQTYTGTSGNPNVNYLSNRNFRIAKLVAGNGREFKGNISNIQIYNRALTATEIQQNFNATRSRYGI